MDIILPLTLKPIVLVSIIFISLTTINGMQLPQLSIPGKSKEGQPEKKYSEDLGVLSESIMKLKGGGLAVLNREDIKQKLLKFSTSKPVLLSIFCGSVGVEKFVKQIAQVEIENTTPIFNGPLLNYGNKLEERMNIFAGEYLTPDKMAYYKKIGFDIDLCLAYIREYHQKQLRLSYVD